MEIFTSYQKERAMTRARMFGAHRAALQTGIPAETIAGWMQDASEESTTNGLMQGASEESTSKGEKKASAKIIRKKSVSPKKKVIGNAKAAKKEKNEQAEVRSIEMTTTRAGRKTKESTKAESVTESKRTRSSRKAGEQTTTASVTEGKRTRTSRKAREQTTDAGLKKSQRAKTVRKTKERAAGTKTGSKQLNGINIVIQSNSGKMISASKICKKVPDNTELVYAKPEEGKLYYVLKDGSKGSTELWEE